MQHTPRRSTSLPRVVLSGPLPPAVLARARASFALIEVPHGAPAADLDAALSDAEGLIGLGLAPAPAQLTRADRLRAVSSVSAGVDAFDLDTVAAAGITLMNTPDALTESVADLAFGLMLACARRIVELAQRVRAGEWRERVGPAEFGCDVHDATVGIVGLGRIGAAVARRARGFSMAIVYTQRTPRADLESDARFASLEDLLEQSDFVVLTVPLTDATAGLIDAAALARMRPGAFLINVSRGEIVDESALAEALARGTIAGAGLDVYTTEPLPADSPLTCLPQVVATPHLGSATAATREAMANCALDNLIGFFRGVPGHVVVSPIPGEPRR